MSELEEIAERHHQPIVGTMTNHPRLLTHLGCAWCRQSWPCDAAKLADRIAVLEGAIRACFDEDGLIPVDSTEGAQWYCVRRGGQKEHVFGISTLETQELRRLVPPEEQR